MNGKHKPVVEFYAHHANYKYFIQMLDVIKNESSEHFPYIPIIVFEAFTIESYINTLGYRHVEDWKEIERIPWRAKITLLHSFSKKKADWSKAPLQFAKEIFKIRDFLAHGKNERVEGEVFNSYHDAKYSLNQHKIKPKALRDIDKDWVINSEDKLHDLLLYLADVMGQPGSWKIMGNAKIVKVEN